MTTEASRAASEGPTAPKMSSSSSSSSRFLHYEGANYFRQRLVLATLSGRGVIIKKIRSDDLHAPGLKDYETSFLRLLDKITDGARIQINNTGTQLKYDPGQLVGCPADGRSLVHECPPSRGLGYWLEALALLLPFARNVSKIRLLGVTNKCATTTSVDVLSGAGGEQDMLSSGDQTSAQVQDLSVDSFRSVTLPWLQKLFSPRKTSANPNQQDQSLTINQGSKNPDSVVLHSNQTNFASDQLSFKVIRRSCGAVVGGNSKDATNSATSTSNGTPTSTSTGEVWFQCPTLVRVRPLNLVGDFRCKRVRGVAFTSGVTPQFATRMCDAARGVLNDFLPDVWIFADHDKAHANKGGTQGGEKSRGFGLSLVAESIDGTYKSVDVCSSGTLAAAERALIEDAETAVPGSDDGDSMEVDSEEEGDRNKASASSKPGNKADVSDVPHALGRAGAARLLAELSLGGCVDSGHQILLLHYLALAEEDEASRVRVGKLTPAAIEYLRYIKDFLNVQFKIRQDVDDSVLLSCVGVGLANISRPTF
ncbi:unnamed protein product [Amoebophrya sp. A25]|nr:unnamed protein product [Amoebophrya sp. A25]|eukprot:GSA25T00014092001.1